MQGIALPTAPRAMMRYHIHADCRYNHQLFERFTHPHHIAIALAPNYCNMINATQVSLEQLMQCTQLTESVELE